MSIHDEMARKALRDGNTSDQFRRAAQGHANRTWLFLLVAAVVWYFANWAWAMIPGAFAVFKAVQSVSATMVAQRLERMEKSRKELERIRNEE
ncbi:MAG: hypothetical protein WBF13_00115 [Candidatus Zixiibacteriota bacterium]